MKDANKQEQDVKDDNFDKDAHSELGDDQVEEDQKTRLTLKETLFYREEQSKILSDSADAHTLEIHQISMLDIINLKVQLERFVWDIFATHLAESGASRWMKVNVSVIRLIIHYFFF